MVKYAAPAQPGGESRGCRMSWLADQHLFRYFEFYLSLLFLISTYLRIRQYRMVVGLVRGLSSRWPRLFQVVKQHGKMFLTRGTIFPLAVSLGLLLIQLLARKLVWPEADAFTASELPDVWPAIPIIVIVGVAMAAFDAWATWTVGEIDRAQMEKYFDQAEFWLRSPASRIVHVVTFGFINPRKMVAVEVQAALVSASKLLNANLWWISLQAGLRIAFGLSLWVSYLVWLHRH
jgi:hypothetical protein